MVYNSIRNRIKKLAIVCLIVPCLNVTAAKYNIDVAGMHAAVQFKISHLGTSWIMGRFDRFNGFFEYDSKKPNESSLSMTIDTASVNSNHAERDHHIRNKKLLNTDKFPQATFVSQSIVFIEDKGLVKGTLTLHGVEQNIQMEVEKIGERRDPWGNYRVGFEGTMMLKLSDYKIKKFLGKSATSLELSVMIEGIRED